MKILYIIGNTNTGGAQRNLIQTATQISKKYDVYFMILREDGKLTSELEGFNIKKFLTYQKSSFDVGSYIKVFNIIKKIKPDVIHSQLYFSNNIARLSKFFRFHKKVIISGERTNDFSSPWKKEPFCSVSLFIDKTLSKYSDRILTNNQELIINFEKLGFNASKIKVIYNGIDTKKHLETKQYINDDKFIVCAVGRLEEAKNLFYLLSQFKMLDTEKFKLIIVGDGRLKENLIKYVELNNITNVTFKGMLNQKDTYSNIKESNCCVLASIYEGLPNIILEYGLFSKPVIVSNIEGNKIVVPNEEYGYIFDLNKKDDLYNKLIDLHRNYASALKKGINLKNRIYEKFSLNKMVDNVEKLYSEELKKYV